MNGDWASNRIELYSLDDNLNLDEWSEEAAAALLPRAVPVMNRSRWLSSGRPLAEMTLLVACHQLLLRCMAPWLALLHGQPVPAAAFAAAPGPVHVDTAWVIHTESEAEEGGSKLST